MLPRKIGSWAIRNSKIISFLPFVGKGMKINSLTVFGFLILKFLSSFRYIRTISLRYKEEHENIYAGSRKSTNEIQHMHNHDKAITNKVKPK